jgi:hypothetical protein
VPGLGQRPIPANSTFTYKWRADTYGSYFYHAHSRGQIDDGAFGPIIIKPADDIPRPFDKIEGADYGELWTAEQNVQPVLLSDWRHKTSEETWTDQLASGVETAICMDSVLVNGKGAVECLSRDVLDAFQAPDIAHIMKPNNLSLTNKGYGFKIRLVARLTRADASRHNFSRSPSRIAQARIFQQFLLTFSISAHPLMALAQL